MISRSVKRETKNEKQILFLFAFFSLFFALFSHINAQDSIPIAKDLSEEKSYQFQQYFFKALSEKAIGNHQKAIENLESCNQIIPEDVSIYFEFSKNYLELQQYENALEYIKRAAAKEPENRWLLQHWVGILDKMRLFDDAISVQKKLVAIHYKEVIKLINLYIKNNQIDLAKQEIIKAESKVVLPKYLKNFSTTSPVKVDDEDEKVADNQSQKSSFTFFETQIKNSKNDDEIIKLTDEALSLYPEQAFLYIAKAKVLTNQNKHQQAIEILEIGIDFAVDDTILKEFYKLLIDNYQKLGNQKEEEKYKQKLKKIQS